MRIRVIAAFAAVALAALAWRPLAAWWCDDLGNLALAKGDDARAFDLFERGLALRPGSRLLLEDRGRARLDRDPAAALRDFQSAGCGAPCVAEMGDAEARLGDADGGLDRTHSQPERAERAGDHAAVPMKRDRQP